MKLKKQILMVPGPTAVPERVLEVMHKPMINHRGPQYENMFKNILAKLKTVFQTQNEVLVYPAAGTGVMEAAVVNFLSPGDKVLAVSIGVFGDRFAEIAQKYGVDIEKFDVEWGKAACPEMLRKRLNADKNKAIKAVLITHNETSTGVTNNIQALSAVAKEHGALTIVDAVSSLGAINLEMDNWGLDVVITGAQKALMIPPGLGFMAVSPKAWDYYTKSTLPKYYWDAKLIQKSQVKNQNPYTPPVSILYGLEESLTMIEEEGLPEIYKRHEKLAKALRAGLKALDLRLLADHENYSVAVTAVLAPENIEPKAVQKIMREKYGITMAGGQKKFDGKIFRIGHLGYVAMTDILITLSCLEMALTELGVKVELGSGVKAAQKILLEE